jgi:phosphoglycerate kinase
MRGDLPIIRTADIAGKKVIVRVDLDVPNAVNPRVEAAGKMVEFLKERGAVKIKAIGHRGEYLAVNDLKLKYPDVEWSDALRDDPREKENDPGYAGELAGDFDIYVNEAFAVSHRKHTSMDALPRFMKSQGRQVFAGLRFEKEIEMLSKVFIKEGRKVLVIGGAKAGDKAEMADKLAPKFNEVLRGGLLPGVSLRADGMDIDDLSIEKYKQEITGAAEIVVAGPMGRFEDVF